MRAVPFPVFSIYDSTLPVKQSEKAAFAFTPTFFRERLSLSNDMHWLATFPLAEVDLRIPGSEKPLGRMIDCAKKLLPCPRFGEQDGSFSLIEKGRWKTYLG